jgi:DNA replication initiation complex subunit (GINS family)
VYDELYKAWMMEKENSELQKLPKDFYSEIIHYVGRIRQEGRMLDQSSPKAKLTSRELSNAKRLVEELLGLRYEKIVKEVALKPLGKELLAPEEQTTLMGLMNSTTSFQYFLKEALQGKVSRVDHNKHPTRVMLRFLKKTPAIAGADLKVYGPFSVEDVATLPIENAKVLVEHGVAVQIDTK